MSRQRVAVRTGTSWTAVLSLLIGLMAAFMLPSSAVDEPTPTPAAATDTSDPSGDAGTKSDEGDPADPATTEPEDEESSEPSEEPTDEPSEEPSEPETSTDPEETAPSAPADDESPESEEPDFGTLSEGTPSTWIRSNNTWYSYVAPGENLDVEFVKTNIGGPNDATIRVRGPGGIDQSCTVGAATPVGEDCTFPDLTSPTAGIWQIDFSDPINNGDYFTWAIDVQSGTTSLPGRVYAEAYYISQTGTSGLVDFTLHYQSEDGFLYRGDFSDYNGINSIFGADAIGVAWAGTCTSAYSSWQWAATGTAGDSTRWDPTDCGDPYKMFFESPDPALPAAATLWDGSTTWLTPPVTLPQLSNLAFAPDSPTVRSGDFTFDTDDFTGTASLQIDVNGDGDYTDPEDRTIPVGVTSDGTQTVTFDGLDGLGNAISPYDDLAAQVVIDKAGEIHFASGDVEVRAGGLAVEALNGPETGSTTLYWDDTHLDPTGRSCLTAQPDGTAGVSSAGGVHGWDCSDEPSLGNTNTGISGAWGDTRTIDDWTYHSINEFEEIEIPGEPQPTWECGTNAPGLLFQTATAGDPTSVHFVDLVTGEYTTPVVGDAGINSVGFNVLDGYVYGGGAGGLIRVGSDGSFEPTGIALPGGSVVGDVDDEGHYWNYNVSTGQWIDVDIAAGTSTSGTAAPPAGTTGGGQDWAYVPGTNKLWRVARDAANNQSVLVGFDRTTHAWTTPVPLGNLGGPGGDNISGAVFADSDGFLYASYNTTGRIARIDVNAGTGAFFADGPASAGNDGARCPSPIYTDYGDAPDSYGTTLADDGPRHGVKDFDETTGEAPLMLGASVDPETDGQPGTDADGDGGDEDGVADPIVLNAGQANTVTVSATNATNQPATLAGWIDLNGNGTFDAGERQTITVPANSGTADYNLTFPASATVPPDTYARFRLFPGDIADADALPTGPAAAGEVEDYVASQPAQDFGDAPQSYGTLLVDNGPRHPVIDGVHLGADIDDESDGQPNPAADGDGADEDGVAFNPALGYPNPTLRTGLDPSSLQPVSNTLEVEASANGFVSVWVDWNQDGDFDDAGEQVANAQQVNAGSNDVTFTQGTNPDDISTYVRVRYSTDEASIATPYGAAPDGEVEDYRVLVERLVPPDTCTPTDTEYYAFTFDKLGARTGTGGVGSTARYGDVSVINGVAVDMLITVVAGDLKETGSGSLPPNGLGTGTGTAIGPDDARWQIDLAATLRYEFFVAGTSTPIPVNGVFTVNDMDGPNLETATFSAADLADYNVSQGSAVTISESGGEVTFSGGQPSTGDPGSRFQIVIEGIDAFEGDWAGFSGSGFGFDGDGDLGIQPPACEDFGDAPQRYGTLLADDGPRHTLSPGLLLGSEIDFDPDGQPSPAADGDDTNRLADEDGVAAPIVVTTGQQTTVSVSATNNTVQAATLVGWIDLNGDGVFGNGAERVIIDVPANSGTDDYDLTFPAGTVTADTFARFRLFPGDILDADAVPTGAAIAGEVEDYPVTVLQPELDIDKFSDATADSRPGDVITYTVTAENTGTGDYTEDNPAPVWDDLSGVLDDATYNNDASADHDPTTPAYGQPIISWEGALPAGETVTITYTVTLKGGGDGLVRNVAFEQCDTDDPDCDTVTPECDPPVGGIDPDTGKVCAEEEYELPKLTIVKVANRTDLPSVGQTVTYTVTVTNQGPGDYTAAEPGTITDDLSDVIDNTSDPANITASVGTAMFTSPELSWTGVLAAGEVATITYDVTYTGGGDEQLTNNACVPVEEAQDPQDPCAVVQIPGSGLDQDKVANPASGTAVEVGEEVTYTLRFTNTGETGATVDTFDDLASVLDDADFVVGSISADTGLTATFDGPGERIVITGTVPVGEELEVTYTVRVRAFADQGDHVLRNALQCQPGDPQPCDPEVTEHPVRALDIEKSSDRTVDTVIGDTVTYMVTAENIGEADYTATDPALVRDILAGVLDDGSYNDDAVADLPGTLGYIEPVIRWEGALAVDQVVTITYTVTLEEGGDLTVRNVAWGGPGPDPECDPPTAEGVDPQTGQPCDEEEFGLPNIEDSKSVDPADRTAVAAGDELEYTLTFTNDGTTAGAVFKDDSLAMLLDDAEIISGPAVTGTGAAGVSATRNGQVIEIRGTLADGDVATVTYRVRVRSDADRVANGADDMLGNFLIPPGEEPPTECEPEADEDSTCNPVSRIVDEKSVDPADRTEVAAGDELTYTLTFENLGQGAGEVEKDDYLGMLLDDAEIISGPDASDPALTATVNGDFIEIRGTLGAGDVVTVTYTVRVKSDADRVADGADDMLGNFLIEPGTPPPTECEPEADEDSTCNPVSRIVDEKSVDPADRTEVAAGDELTYTLTFENLGNGAGEVEKDDYLGMLLDDAEIISGPDASDPALTATLNGDFIEIRGTLGAGDVVTVTYTVRVKSDADRVADGADDMLGNFLIEPGTPPPTDCEPVGDEDSTCNPVSRIVDEKSVEPADRTSVEAGDELTYTLTFENLGQGAGDVEKDDYIGMLLDDAVIISGPTVAGQGNLTATLSGERVEIRGTLGAGDVATVTYTVRVKPDADRVADGGDDMLGNFLIETDEEPPTECEPEADEDSTCNPVSRIVDEKSVEPADRTSVEAGDELTYTLTFENLGQGAGDVEKDDYIGMLLDDATIISGPDASDPALTATLNGDFIEIRGTLGAGDVVTVTYTVRVKSDADRVADGADDMLGNFLIEPGTTPPTECEPEADEDSTCNPVSRIVDEKSVDPADRTTVAAGDELTYTLTFENLGNGAGDVEKDDYIGMLLDDAEIISGPTVAGGGLTATLNGDLIEIRGTLGAGDVVTVTYTVRVKTDADREADDADNMLGNFLIEPGTTPPTECEPAAEEDSTCNPVRELDIEKTSDRTADTKIGDTVTYTVTARNVGNGDYTTADPAIVRDILAGVLDDADYNNNAAADQPGNLSYSAPIIEWTGALAVDDVVTVTYTVTLKAGGDLVVRNVTWGNGGDPVECDPPTAEGFDPDTGKPCDEEEFGLPDIVDNKKVDPKKGSTVVSGQTLTYTLTFTNNGTAPGTVDKVDNLEQILDDAKIVTAPASSDPALSVSAISGGEFTITGTLQPGQTVTVTYTVEVKKPANLGDKFLGNYLLEPGTTPPTPEECLAQMDEDSTCNPVSDIKPKKTVDPKDGSNVNGGDELTYTLTFTNTGKGAGEVEYVDKMAGILDDATLIKGPKSSDGAITATLKDGKIKISGTLAGGETVTVTYTVRVKAYGDQGDHVLENFLVPPGISNEKCVKGDPLCTKNPIPPPADPPNDPPGPPGIPNTGGPALAALLAGLALLIGGGLFLYMSRKRRRAQEADGEESSLAEVDTA